MMTGDTVEIIKDKKEVTLDEFLSGYHNDLFTKIKVINGTDIDAYIPVSGTMGT